MFQPFSPQRTALMLCLNLALAGCATNTPQLQSGAFDADNKRNAAASTVPSQIRYDRYTIISTKPKPDQLQLLDQIINLRIPDALSPSVHQAMTYALRHSGYQLCSATGNVGVLFAHPLPASQYRLGPISVREAMQMLAGPAWEMQVDELARRICFSVRPAFQHPAPGIPSTQAIAAPSTKPLTVGGQR
ncbi:PilL N-terminal domain-containing protein [Pseudomonas sp. DWP3-1-2]|uniref:PFGI-1 class ICE element type IV pilus protein PilL2 n=1 Tax=Pseudomonas sp. DWP3-1-2 TaxID=2804645 RepID=UPI003CEC141E